MLHTRVLIELLGRLEGVPPGRSGPSRMPRSFLDSWVPLKLYGPSQTPGSFPNYWLHPGHLGPSWTPGSQTADNLLDMMCTLEYITLHIRV